MPKILHTTQTFERTLDAIKEKGLKINTAKAGVTILEENNLKAEILAPASESYNNLNNYSAVIKLVYGDNTFLFMGDAEEQVEQEIINSDIQANVLKIGHHGSKTSSSPAFLQKVKPTVAIISCGTGNAYGHPDSIVLERLDNQDVKVYRTDEQGTIIAVSDGIHITINQNIAEIMPNAPPEKEMQVENEITEVITKKSQPQKVFVTKTGECYHKGGCKYLRKSRIPISLEKAKLNYKACKVCKP